MTTHASLTGTDLHEPKGAGSASADQIYAANGAASGTWRKVTSASVDTTSIKNVNKKSITVVLPDVSTASDIYVPIYDACVLNTAGIALQAAIGTADSILTFNNNGSATIGTKTITESGSAAGNLFQFTASSNNTFTSGTFLKITTDGGSSNTVSLIIVLNFTLT